MRIHYLDEPGNNYILILLFSEIRLREYSFCPKHLRFSHHPANFLELE